MSELTRKIIHIDMDAFYASVEQRDNPDLKGRPVAVGGSRERGVVAAASYEARKYGVHSAMPSSQAARLCPDLVFVKARFDVYKDVSRSIRSIFQQYTDLIEPLSLDEAYLDVTYPKKGKPSATLIAKEIKARIKKELHLTASAGISYCKFLAKIASDMDKPDGIYVILPKDADEFLKKLPIKKFHGIGKVTADKMKKAGIFIGNDLRKLSYEDVIRRYGKVGSFYYNIVRGIDNRPVNPERNRKSVSAENTFSKDLTQMQQVEEKVNKIGAEVWRRYDGLSVTGRTATVKIKYSDFHQITRSKTIEEGIRSEQKFMELIDDIITTEDELIGDGIRLIGLGISNFITKEDRPNPQMSIDF
jgi:DNA polymerase-4